MICASAILAALYFRSCGSSIREAVVEALLLVSLFIALATHLLTPFSALDRGCLIPLWGAFALGLLLLLHRNRRKVAAAISEDREILLQRPSPFRIWCAATALCTFVCAFFAGINNWDSLTYHMPRVFYWIQQKSAAFYATENIRQNVLSPFAEYAFLHGWLLSGSDRFAPLVQWTAFVGAGFSASLLGERLGGPRAGQAALLLAWSIPMAVVQSSSTQNDLVAAFFALSALLFLLRGLEKPKGAPDLVRSAVAASLGALTKSTVLIWLPSMGAVLLVCAAFRRRELLPRIARFFAVAIPVAALVWGPFLARTYDAYGSPLGPKEETARYAIAKISLAATALNVVRNTAIEFVTPSDRVNLVAEQTLKKISPLDLDSPSSIFGGWEFKILRRGILTSDFMPNPFHTALFFALLLATFRSAKRPDTDTRARLPYALALVAASIGFCAYLRWQPFHTRLHMQWLMLAAPWMAAELADWSRLRPSRWWGRGAVLFALMPFACLAFAQERPLVGSSSVLTTDRESQRFSVFTAERVRQEQIEACLERVQNSAHPRAFDLIIHGEVCEYPLITAILKSCKAASPCDIRKASPSDFPSSSTEAVLVRNAEIDLAGNANYARFCAGDGFQLLLRRSR